jgi:rod shape-determining protein MreD
VSRIALTSRDLRMKQAQRRYVPLLSVVIACLFALLPIVMSTPVIPDFAFLTLIGWRLLRPELWSARTALPLGAFNDLVSGHPFGQSIALWSIAFLALDLVDSRTLYRDFLMDWLLASALIIFYTFGDWYIGRLMGNTANFSIMLPQAAVAVLAYPIVARTVTGLDRWRLAR